MPNEPDVPAAPLHLRIYRQDDATVVECSGRLISGGTDQLRSEVKALFPQTKRVTLDLTNVTQMDSMGLGAIVSLYASAKARLRSQADQFEQSRTGNFPRHESALGIRSLWRALH